MKLLHLAKNAAGDRAVAAAEREDFTASREWQALAAEIDRLMRDAVTAMARL